MPICTATVILFRIVNDIFALLPRLTVVSRDDVVFRVFYTMTLLHVCGPRLAN